MTATPRTIAAQILAKIAANDPRNAKPSEAMLQAWTEHLDDANISLDDGLLAVKNLYARYRDRVPLASEVIAEAKRIAGERRSRRSETVIAACRDCDEYGWLLGADGTVADPATKCGHPAVGAA